VIEDEQVSVVHVRGDLCAPKVRGAGFRDENHVGKDVVRSPEDVLVVELEQIAEIRRLRPEGAYIEKFDRLENVATAQHGLLKDGDEVGSFQFQPEPDRAVLSRRLAEVDLQDFRARFKSS
jgi:hypothetical protein